MSSRSEQARTAESLPLPGGDFRMFVTRLGIQGLLSLGLLENPATGKAQTNLDQARMIVADLEMLRDKTFGSLDEEETRALDKVLGDMQHHLVQHAGEAEVTQE